MKMRLKYSIIALAAAMTLACCTEENGGSDLVRLAPSGISGSSIVVTRAAEYTNFNPTDGFTMGVFWKSSSAESTPCRAQGQFTFKDSIWSSDVRLKKTEYDIFVYSPKNDSATFYPDSNKLVLPAMTVSAHDVLVADGLNGKGKGVSVGNYSYTLAADKNDFAADQIPTDSIDLKMSHLFSKLTVKIAVCAEYDSLRTIHINKVELGSDKSAKATVTFTDHGAVVGWSDWKTLSKMDWAVAPSDSGLYLNTDYQTYGSAYMLPEVLSGKQNLSLRVTYDVYDKAEKKIRSANVAENKLTIEDVTLESGKNYIKKILIEPSYLGRLSDNDEPTLKF